MTMPPVAHSVVVMELQQLVPDGPVEVQRWRADVLLSRVGARVRTPHTHTTARTHTYTHTHTHTQQAFIYTPGNGGGRRGRTGGEAVAHRSQSTMAAMNESTSSTKVRASGGTVCECSLRADWQTDLRRRQAAAPASPASTPAIDRSCSHPPIQVGRAWADALCASQSPPQ
eukprot:GHVU01079807.1.p1 GENE.GHVU01079807.1~~GHVU01079807.1.p1  ORF type:complete len:171 (-),score=13.52 GHVU01079807.1:179-691(-)